MKTKNLILGLFATALTFTACTDDEGVDFTPVVPGAYENGLLITNEGNFGQGNATVSYVSNDFLTTQNDIFTAVNASPLGDTAQSMAFYNDLAYIVVNGSDKIEVVNKNTFVSVATIDSGLSNPRYMAFANGKGYITNWGDGTDATDDFIAVIDLGTNTVSSTIAVVEGPEKIISVGGKLYVSHKGGYGQGNTLSVIASDDSVTSIAVGDVPDEMVLVNDRLWVVCEGRPSYAAPETAGKLVEIDTNTDVVSQTFDFAATEHPSKLDADGNQLYYSLGGKIYTMENIALSLPTTSIITTTTYGMAVHSGKLFTTNVDYSNPGVLTVYDLSNNSEITHTTVGTNASGIYFN